MQINVVTLPDNTLASEGKSNHLTPSKLFKNASTGSVCILLLLANIDLVPRIYSNIKEKRCSRRIVLQPSQKALKHIY